MDGVPDGYRETSHVNLIIGTKGNPLQNIMRDLKRHTSETLHKSIQTNNAESRRERILWIACPDLFIRMRKSSKEKQECCKVSVMATGKPSNTINQQ
ncbi:hypothetical protein BH20BAC1_BH20BAC1_22550 [soil metagenome]